LEYAKAPTDASAPACCSPNREERREREPGVELKAPGVGVEIGRRDLIAGAAEPSGSAALTVVTLAESRAVVLQFHVFLGAAPMSTSAAIRLFRAGDRLAKELQDQDDHHRA
jgi:hypothetical protein